jgi:hypothetical protein
MKPVWALINCHDRARFEVHMFSDGGNPSAAGGYRDHPDDNIHVIRGVANELVARIIADAAQLRRPATRFGPSWWIWARAGSSRRLHC